ncbi:MotA/TolQ/ExbB proton channel family protein [Rhabdochromatium marinum]|uniref:MotA/TolQ/ExbB proton channel family protein n=1 Tax=Rhabdochromatium marinum TaxID=48729 RepID=UPI001908F54C|nr:MotA/TolQ/ExbB proton channel family protein [Rhabdochromatium marinum]MBK1648342.1 hypothetical protein [Rhabdochromatium marinum]
MPAPLFSARQILVPLSVAASVTVALWLTTLSLSDWLAPLLESSTISRYLNNGFCQLMLAIFTTITLYAALQALGLQVERSQLHRRFATQSIPPRPWQPWLDSLSGRDSQEAGASAWILQDQEAEAVRSTPEHSTAISDYLLLVRAQQHQHNFAPIGFAIWVLPLLGFIGTVVGITQAIGGLEQSVSPEAALGAGLGSVLGGLSFAFDTTFVGLVLVIPTMLYWIALRARAQWLDMHYYQSLLTQAQPQQARP